MLRVYDIEKCIYLCAYPGNFMKYGNYVFNAKNTRNADFYNMHMFFFQKMCNFVDAYFSCQLHQFG